MSKICFLVESNFLSTPHVGVRNLILSLYKLLGTQHDVSLACADQTASGKIQWAKMYLEETIQPEESRRSFAGTPKEVLDQFIYAHVHYSVQPRYKSYRIDMGVDFCFDDFDICIITNPWLIHFQQRLPFKKLFGIVYDLVPNAYVFTKPLKPHDFAMRHLRGFEYFNAHCHGIIAISEATKNDYCRVFPQHKDKTHVLPPIVPTAYFTQAAAEKQRTENSIILAAPFDPRKGMALIPDLLKRVKDSIDTLYIYGNFRCTLIQTCDFITHLDVQHIEWVMNAPDNVVSDMYSKSKLLLFPSLQEGLGLPILEAQWRGTRVAVQNAPPMKDLTLDGSYLLTKNIDEDAAAIEQIIKDNNFSCDALAQKARKKFSTTHVQRILEDLFAA